MARWMGIDYGSKRTGLAVTDPLKIIVSALDTVATDDIIPYLESYMENETVELIVLGEPLHADGNPMSQHQHVIGLSRQIKKRFPNLEVVLHDERFTSVDAKEIIMRSGAKKKKRRDKQLIDKISAALILESYMKSEGLY